MSADVETLNEPLRSRVKAVVAHSDGRVSVVSARRTRDEQIALRRINCGTSDYDIFRKPYDQCTPPTAKPGESKHETGDAVDLGGDLALAVQLGKLYGLKQTVNDDPYHFEAAGGSFDLGDVPIVGGAIGAASNAVSGGLSAVEAGAKFAALLTRRETWLRVIGVVLGLVLVVLGVSLMMGDLAAGALPGVGMVSGGAEVEA